MSYIVEKLISPPEEIIKQFPLEKELESKVKADRSAISQIIEGKDKRKLLIIGPCSAWPDTAIINYAKQLKLLEEKYSDKLKIVMRLYTQKPRTNLGWTGSANQPDPFQKPDLEKGIIYSRQMMIEVLKIGLPIADEALFTHNEGYFTDLLSWVAIGARSSEDQEHRIYASMINHPVGLKNPSSGNLDIAISSIIAAQNQHVFLLNQKQIKTSGNKHAHLVLRGGNGQSNIYLEDLKKTHKKIKETNLSHPSIIVDLSHDNSIDPATGKKDPLKQPEALQRVLTHIKKDAPELNETIKGFMIESFLKTGNQNINNFTKKEELDLEGLSITDACISFEKTIKLIEDLYEKL